jgi:hypothetical protein
MADTRESKTANLRAIYAKIARIAAENNEPYLQALTRIGSDRGQVGTPAAAEDNPATDYNVISLTEAIIIRRRSHPSVASRCGPRLRGR